MIETIDLRNFELVSNYIVVLLDPDYNFKEVTGPDGTKVEIQLIDLTVTQAQNQSITGTILRLPERLLFHGELNTHEKGKTISGDEYESLMRNSMPFEVDLNVKEGDKVVFDYKVGLHAESEDRILKDVTHGYCMLMEYHNLFAKEVNNELIPLNGWVFFNRDQNPAEYQLPSGLWMVEKVNKYGILKGTVLSADDPVKDYIESGTDDLVEIKAGSRIIVQKGFGYRIAYDLHAGKYAGLECVKRKNILCTFDHVV